MSISLLAETWQQRLVDFADSGLSVSEWCQKNSTPTRRFYYWRQRLGRDSDSSQTVDWLPLAPDVQPQPQSTDIITLKIAGAEIDLYSGFNPALLRCIVQALAPEQC